MKIEKQTYNVRRATGGQVSPVRVSIDISIANAQIQTKLAEISLDLGYELPIICTPYELLGD